MGIKVYKFGCARPDKLEAEAIQDQLYISYRYRLMLWHLTVAARELYKARRREYFPEIVDLEQEYDRQKSILELLEQQQREEKSSEFKQQIQDLRKALRTLRNSLRDMARDAKENEQFKQHIEQDRAREGVLHRALRAVFSKTFGLYSGTYMLIEEAARKARTATGSSLPKPRWRGVGTLGIYLQDGRSVADVSQKNPHLWIKFPDRSKGGHKKRSQGAVVYRLRSANRQPVMLYLRTMIDRDLPPDAQILWAKLAVNLVGDRQYGRYVYSVQLTVRSASFDRSEYGAGVVAVCLHDNAIKYSDGYAEEQEYDPQLRMRRCSELQSVRDLNRNAAIGALRGWFERQDEIDDKLLDELADIETHLSCRRLVSFVDRVWPQLPDKLRAFLRDWRYQENHLYMWWSDMGRKERGRRNDLYRNFAAQLRRKYRTVVIDNIDLRTVRTVERNDKALHLLRTYIIQAFGPDCTYVLPGANCAELLQAQSAAEAKSLQTFQKPSRIATARKKRIRVVESVPE